VFLPPKGTGESQIRPAAGDLWPILSVENRAGALWPIPSGLHFREQPWWRITDGPATSRPDRVDGYVFTKNAENRFHRCGDRAMSVHDGRGTKPVPQKEISHEH